MSRVLRTDAEIRAAGAAAVTGWTLTDRQADQLAALLTPVRDEVRRPAERNKPAA